MTRFTVHLCGAWAAAGLLLLATLACRRSAPESQAPALPAEFAEFAGFYKQFHEDSLFQMAHIQFPLKGLPPDVDSATLAADNFYWRQEDWTMHRPLDPSNADFQRTFTPYSQDLILERITHKSGEYGMLRRWARVGGEWQLIYYAAMNRLARQPAGGGEIDIEGGY